MIKAVLKFLMVVAAVSALTGCKLAVIVTSGGDVTSLSGTRDCAGGTVCEFQITDANFSDSFTAVAKPGYEFVKWQKSSDFFCGDSTSPTCMVALSGNAVLDEVIIALFNMSYIMPTFKDVGIDTDGDGVRNELDEDDDNDGVFDVDDACPLEGPNTNGFGCPGTPITDTIAVGGKEWAQAILFYRLSWNQINIVCPAGVCAGVLNGYDVTGWKWATVDEVNSLFNYYIGSAVLGPDPSNVQTLSSWGREFFLSGGWTSDPGTLTLTGTLSIQGFVSTPLSIYGRPYIGNMSGWISQLGDSVSNASTFAIGGTPDTAGTIGAWLYR